MHSPSQHPESTQNLAETEPWCITLEYNERDGDHHVTTSTDTHAEGEVQEPTHPRRHRKDALRNDVLAAAIRQVVRGGLQQHEQAIMEGNLEQIKATFIELQRVYHLYEVFSVDTIRKLLIAARKRHLAGKKAKGTSRASGHKWDAIYRCYDQLVAEGYKGEKLTNKLLRWYVSTTGRDIRKDVLLRGLRKSGRGRDTR